MIKSFREYVEKLQACGEIVTVGSDAHAPEQIGSNFCLIEDFLREAGFRYRTEFKDRGAGEKGTVNGNIRVFRSRGNQGDASILDVFQQGLLLLPVEILNFVQIEENTGIAENIFGRGGDIADIGKRSRGGIEPVEGHTGLLGDDIGSGGFSGAGRAGEDHIGEAAGIAKTAENAVFSEQVRLPYHVGKIFGAKPIGKRLILHRVVLSWDKSHISIGRAVRRACFP